jgi:hypothetical protein
MGSRRLSFYSQLKLTAESRFFDISIANLHENSTKFEIFSQHVYWDQGNRLTKKTGLEKPRWTASLMSVVSWMSMMSLISVVARLSVMSVISVILGDNKCPIIS